MDLRSVAKLFSRSVLRQLAEEDGVKQFRALAQASGLATPDGPAKTIADVLKDGFDVLLRDYRNEYVYKNLIAQQLMLERHEVGEAVMLTEFAAYDSYADLVILNGTSTVYEIKSELDNYSRLEKQLRDYLKIFEKVNVVTHHSCSDTLCRRLPQEVGVITLNDAGKLVTVREPQGGLEKLSSLAMFYSLRKAEYEAVLMTADGQLPREITFSLRRACADRFEQLPPAFVHEMMVCILKSRDRKHRRDLFARALPGAVAHFGLSNRFSAKESRGFLQAMQCQLT